MAKSQQREKKGILLALTSTSTKSTFNGVSSGDGDLTPSTSVKFLGYNNHTSTGTTPPRGRSVSLFV